MIHKIRMGVNLLGTEHKTAEHKSSLTQCKGTAKPLPEGLYLIG
jgi:hypothetical protein